MYFVYILWIVVFNYRMVDVHGKEIDDLFAGYLPQTTSPLENEDLSIALIVIGSVFLIGLIICIIVIIRRRRHER